MIARATSDLHLTPATASYVFAALDELRADAEKRGGATILCGDIFDQGEQVHMPTWNRLRDVLALWPGFVYILAGNHDQYDDQGRNCLEGLDGGESSPVIVSSRPERWSELGSVVPWVPPSRFDAALAVADGARPGDAEEPGYIWCHAAFRGAYMNAMRRDKDGISCKAIPVGKLVIAGHYHMPQTLGRLIYCGSPYETSFAEEGQAKGWLAWYDDDPLPRRIPFGDLGAPRHVTVRWNPDEGPPTRPADLRPHDRVRVVTDATRKVAIDQAKQLADAGLEGAALIATPDIALGRGVIDGAGDPREALEQYMRHKAAGDPAYPAPTEMHEWAEEAKLWDAGS